jgi:hypothetical protein
MNHFKCLQWKTPLFIKKEENDDTLFLENFISNVFDLNEEKEDVNNEKEVPYIFRSLKL